MSDDLGLKRATRRLLFADAPGNPEQIPGAGTSAADGADRHLRVKVTINLDADVVQFFKDWAKTDGRPYQSLVNTVLREYVQGSRPEQLAQEVQKLLLADPDFAEQVGAVLQRRFS